MSRFFRIFITLTSLLPATLLQAQPPGVTREMIARQLPLEGAPLAIPGPYEVVSEGAFDAPGFILFRPRDLSAFPARDTLPLLVWGNGGCALDDPRYAGYLSTIASHGFLVMTTVAVEGEERRSANVDDMLDEVTWAEAENERDGAALKGKIRIDQIAAMGQSCGGFRMAAAAGQDPRVSLVGMFNSGTTEADILSGLHAPVLLINGGEVDFMYGPSHDTFEAINHQPVFYGARDNAGHTATMFHPGGGEFANVASNWLKYHFKGDQEAGKMFVGSNCALCTNPNWETESKGLD